MTESIFWELIDIASERASGDFEEQTALLVDFLLDFTIQDIHDFAALMQEKIDELSTVEIFAAFYIIFHEEPSSQYYFNFRTWLLGKGKNLMERILQDAAIVDSMVGPADKEIIRGQAMSQVPVLAYYVKTKRHDYEGTDFRDSVNVEIPVTELEIQRKWAIKYPRLRRIFWRAYNI